MKNISLLILFISVSLFSFSQKKDTFQLFEKSKKIKKDAVKEIQAHPQNKQDSVFYIKYGKSSLKCNGYCIHEATVDPLNIVKVEKSSAADKNYPVKTDTSSNTTEQWSSLVSSVEINSFMSIPEKIGNPGGGDGEYEWIELNYAGKIHKITFDNTGPDEYEGIKNLLLLLKKVTGF